MLCINKIKIVLSSNPDTRINKIKIVLSSNPDTRVNLHHQNCLYAIIPDWS